MTVNAHAENDSVPKVLIRNLGKVIGYKVWARQRMKYYLAVNKE